MKSSSSDKLNGTLLAAKGSVKEMVGKLTDNPKLVAKGKSDKFAGKVQNKIGQVEQVLGK